LILGYGGEQVVVVRKMANMNTTKLCLNCDSEMIERNPGNYICSNCGAEITAED
jgi:transposase